MNTTYRQSVKSFVVLFVLALAVGFSVQVRADESGYEGVQTNVTVQSGCVVREPVVVIENLPCTECEWRRIFDAAWHSVVDDMKSMVKGPVEIAMPILSYAALSGKRDMGRHVLPLFAAYAVGYVFHKEFKKLSENLMARVIHGEDSLNEDQFSEKAASRSVKVAALMITVLGLRRAAEFFLVNNMLIADLIAQFESPQRMEVLTATGNFWEKLYKTKAVRALNDSIVLPDESAQDQADGEAVEHPLWRVDTYLIDAVRQIPAQVLERMHYVLEGALVSYAGYRTAKLLVNKPDGKNLAVDITREMIRKFVLFIVPAAYWAAIYSQQIDPEARIGSVVPFCAGLFAEVSFVGILPYLYGRSGLAEISLAGILPVLSHGFAWGEGLE